MPGVRNPPKYTIPPPGSAGLLAHPKEEQAVTFLLQEMASQSPSPHSQGSEPSVPLGQSSEDSIQFSSEDSVLQVLFHVELLSGNLSHLSWQCHALTSLLWGGIPNPKVGV